MLVILSPTTSVDVGIRSIHDTISILHFRISSSRIRIFAAIVRTDADIINLYGLLFTSVRTELIHPVVKVSVFGVYVMAVNVFNTRL